MNRQGKWRLWLLLSALAAVVVAVFCLPRIPQSETYHHFADQRAILRVPNGANVLSNIFFLIVGALGLWALLRDASANGIRFLDPRERWPYAIFFSASRSLPSARAITISLPMTRGSSGTTCR